MQPSLNRLSKNSGREFRSGEPYSDRYRRIFHFFGLRENPFTISPDPRYLSFNPQIQHALDAITGGIRTGQGLMLLTGEVGTGKTTLTNYLLNWSRQQQVPTSFIFNSRLSVDDFYDFVLFDFGIACESKDRAVKHSLLISWLFTRYPSHKTSLLIIDEAQGLPSAVLEEILLLNLETAQAKLLQIVLVGQPELDEKLARPGLRQLRERMAVQCKIGPLDFDEASLYIHRRIRVAGGRDEPIFQPDALYAVHSYSRGIPRIMNILCEHALINAYTSQIRRVTPEIVHEVAQEFQLPKLAPRDVRRDFDITIRTKPFAPPLNSHTMRMDTAEAETAESPIAEHCEAEFTQAPVPIISEEPVVSIEPVQQRAEKLNAIMARQISAWREWLVKPLSSWSPDSWLRRWSARNTATLRFPIVQQAAMSVIGWLQQPIRPARLARKAVPESVHKRLAQFQEDEKQLRS